jgi:hypothetical protein
MSPSSSRNSFESLVVQEVAALEPERLRVPLNLEKWSRIRLQLVDVVDPEGNPESKSVATTPIKVRSSPNPGITESLASQFSFPSKTHRLGALQ